MTLYQTFCSIRADQVAVGLTKPCYTVKLHAGVCRYYQSFLVCALPYFKFSCIFSPHSMTEQSCGIWSTLTEAISCAHPTEVLSRHLASFDLVHALVECARSTYDIWMHGSWFLLDLMKRIPVNPNFV